MLFVHMTNNTPSTTNSFESPEDILLLLRAQQESAYTTFNLHSMASNSELAELVGFLKDSRSDVRDLAVKNVLSLTGSEELLEPLTENNACTLLVRLLGDVGQIAKNAASALVNLSVNDMVVKSLLENKVFWSALLSNLSSKECSAREETLKLVQNVTRNEDGAERLLLGRLGEEHLGLDVLILINQFLENTDKAEYDRIAQLITNITTVENGRTLLLDPKKRVLQSILPELSSERVERRRGIAGAIHNCCLDVETHKRLLTQTDVLPYITTRFFIPAGIDDEEDKEGMHPMVLKALEDGRRTPSILETEDDEEVRHLLVKSLLLLLSTRAVREEARKQQIYQVLKRYHLEETVEEISDDVFKVVDLLLGDEEEQILEVDEEVEQLKSQLSELKTTTDEVAPEPKEETPVTTATPGKKVKVPEFEAKPTEPTTKPLADDSVLYDMD